MMSEERERRCLVKQDGRADGRAVWQIATLGSQSWQASPLVRRLDVTPRAVCECVSESEFAGVHTCMYAEPTDGRQRANQGSRLARGVWTISLLYSMNRHTLVSPISHSSTAN